MRLRRIEREIETVREMNGAVARERKKSENDRAKAIMNKMRLRWMLRESRSRRSTRCYTVQCSAVQYSTVLYCTVLYGTVLWCSSTHTPANIYPVAKARSYARCTVQKVKCGTSLRGREEQRKWKILLITK